MEISGKGLFQFDQETSSLIGNQTYHRTNMSSPYQPNSCYESDYECICIKINGKTCSAPLNILSSVYSKQIIFRHNTVIIPHNTCIAHIPAFNYLDCVF